MAILKPVSAYPNKNTVDATEQNTFNTVIQGASSVVSAYQVFVYDMDTYTQLYDSGKITLSKTLTAGQTLSMDIPVISGMSNGYSYFWLVRLFQYESTIFITNSVVQTGSTETSIVLRQHNNIKAGMTLKIGGNKRSILSYDKVTGIALIATSFPEIPVLNTKCEIYSDFVDSINFPFFAKKKPIIMLTGLNSTGISRFGRFYATFSQEQNVGIKWHRFQLFDKDYKIIKDTGKIFDSDLTFTYANFKTGNYYFVSCFIEDTSGIVTESNLLRIDVAYQEFSFDTGVSVVQNCDNNTVEISWQSDRFATAKVDGEYSYIYNSDVYALGQTVYGIPVDGVNYFWYDEDPTGEDAIWNDAQYWTESSQSVEQKRLYISRGSLLYDSLSSKDLYINDNDFTLLTDIRIPHTKQGKLISLTGIVEDYYLEIDGYNLNYSLNGEKTFIRTILPTIMVGQTIDGIQESNTGYIWDDSIVWDDSYVWTESLDFAKKYKVAMLPNEVQLTEI